jgi:hypothetical protein
LDIAVTFRRFSRSFNFKKAPYKRGAFFLYHPVDLQPLPQQAVERLATLPLWSGTGVTAFFFLA